MNTKYFFTIAIAITLIALTGCGRKTTGINNGYEDDVFGNDIAMEARFENGTLVTEVSFSDIKFSYDSFIIPANEVADVEAVIDYMTANPGIVVICEGHCDERGTTDYNLSLGENRAQSVRAYMVNAGINPTRIQTRSMGEDDPLDFGHNSSAWMNNRRVEFELYR
ncbi:MAG: OmpA family protein [Kiritimatiellae bacterium]|nr:OmpA family protein [Kiritimatiellia bacterium]